MKRIFVAVGVLMSLSSAGLAADMPVKARVAAPASLFDWNGFYVGGSLGAAWDDPEVTFNGGTKSTGIKDSAVIGGGHVGYNWQSGNFLIGVEANWLATGLNKMGACPNAAVACGFKIPSVWVAGPRIGFVSGPSNNLLWYLTGGYAQGTVKTPLPSIADDSGSSTNHGWALGAGLEWMFAPNWIAGVEYMHIDLSDKLQPVIEPRRAGSDIEMIQFRLSYKFDPFGKSPVIAKY
jgi:outer membrane immunogenic protein